MGKRCLQSRPREPAPNVSPARKGWVHKGGRAPEVRHHTLRLFIKWGEPWRDLQFRGPFVEMFFDRLSWVFGSPKLMKTSRRGRSKATALGFTELKPSRAQEETRVRFTSSKLSANRSISAFSM